MKREEILKKWDKVSSTRKNIWVSEIVFNHPVRRVDWIGYFASDKEDDREYTLPSYSDNMSTAWKVVEQIRADAPPVRNAFKAMLGVDIFQLDPDLICRSAILAVLEEGETCS
ncbi:hypothetical protein M2277_000835 [Paenibacillus sp. LBL]|uniref:hypothetical protein n=1 Tax=Paenibacillus sp. LBL TaxID=2940563 RepID=UPI0024745736|nr:hypothetical protein [Paenibacillus sp. LBL]MDH6670191.1 hypothetical protein [Paenibacillus sp. LBL]